MSTLEAILNPTSPLPSVPSAIERARAAVIATAAEYLEIPDSALESPWAWQGGDMDVRYGVFRAAETIVDAEASVETAMAGTPRGAAAVRIAAATVARWTLHGRLAGLEEAILDRVPKDGEWTLRETLGHIVGGQRGFGWSTRWWLARPADAERIFRMPPEASALADEELPSDDEEAAGTIGEIAARLDATLDEDALRFGRLSEAALATHAGYGGAAVDIGFRLTRWGSHIEEHTIQVDKTLDWLGYQPREVERIVQRLFATWGRLEARLFPAATTPPGVDATLDRMAATLVEEAGSVRAAAA
jgi:hypothetical protein